jgi:Dolichyl-phosphate-mannose-protein mannosyltransferase
MLRFMALKPPKAQRDVLRALAAPVAWTVYLALPVAGWGWLSGVPLSFLESGAIGLVWWIWASNRQLPGWRVLTVLTLVKLLLGFVLVDRGFLAHYYANATWTPPVERSFDYHRADVTRRDTQLAFGGKNQPDLPLNFFNNSRFNFYRRTDPQRDKLGYSVLWSGVFQTRSESLTFYLAAAPGITGEMTVDDRTVGVLDDRSESTGSFNVGAGWHRLVIRVAAPYGSGRRVEAGEVVDGFKRPFDRWNILPAPVGVLRLTIDGVLQWLTRGLDGLVLLWLAAMTVNRARVDWRERRIVRLLWLGALAEALLYALPYARHVVILTGGDDWLSYEHLGRAIGLGDPLLSQPGPVRGQHAPFYYQPLYPYFIALMHLIFGDGLFGLMFVQRLLVAAAVGAIAAMTQIFFDARTGLVALVLGGLFIYVTAGRWSAMLLGETLFTPLLACWAWLLARAAADPLSSSRMVFAGVIGGLATLTRTSLFAAWPLVLPVWSASLGRPRARSTTIILASMIAVIGLATLRNWVVSGTFVPVVSSFSINLAASNVSGRNVQRPPETRAVTYERLRVPMPMQRTAEFAVQQPGQFFDQLWRKGLYAVGFFDLSGFKGGAATGTALLYVGMWSAAIVGLIRFLRSEAHHRWPIVAVPGLAALSHLVVVILFFYPVYNDRLIVPMYPLLIPYAAFAVEPLASWARREAWRLAPVLLAIAALVIFFPPVERSADLIAFLVIMAAVLACASDGQPEIAPQAWLYLAYVVWVVAMAAWESFFGGHPAFRRALLFPLVVFAAARLTRNEMGRRLTIAGLFAGAVIGAVLTGLSSDAFHLSLVWAAVAAVTASFALLSRRWPAVGGAAAAVAGVAITVALLVPTLQLFDLDLPDRYADISRDVSNSIAGIAGAGGELTQDLRDLLTACFVAPFFSGLYVLRQVGVVMFFLFGFWIQALVRSRRENGLVNVRTRRACQGALVAACLLALIGGVPRDWNPNRAGYPALALGILLGLVEAGSARNSARITGKLA